MADPDKEKYRREDKDKDFLNTWPFIIHFHWKAFLNKILVHSDRVGPVNRHRLDKKNEIAKVKTVKKIDAAAGNREYDIQSRLTVIRS
jgi:hypothetical protein